MLGISTFRYFFNSDRSQKSLLLSEPISPRCWRPPIQPLSQPSPAEGRQADSAGFGSLCEGRGQTRGALLTTLPPGPPVPLWLLFPSFLFILSLCYKLLFIMGDNSFLEIMIILLSLSSFLPSWEK